MVYSPDIAALAAQMTPLVERLEGQWESSVSELSVRLPRERLVEMATALRDDETLRFTMLMDVCGVDYPARIERFDVVYHLLSLSLNQRIRLKVATDEVTAVPSLCGLFPTANWYEREVWDMYGVLFANHPDLRRILTDYGFDGHPQRKDFPLTGYVELRYDDVQKRVVYEPVKLAQAFRSFDYLSPWEGAEGYDQPQNTTNQTTTNQTGGKAA